jgi:hypothetical protein
MRFRIVLATVAAGFSAPGAPAASAQAPIATEPYVSKLASYDGILVWSHFDAAAGVFRLQARVRGRMLVLQATAQPEPFDVSLGPDARGRPVAVYSRCVTDAQPPWTTGPVSVPGPLPRACRIYEYDFRARREHPLAGLPRGGSDYLPTIWRGTVAYVRVGGRHGPALFEQSLSAPVVVVHRGGRRLRRRGRIVAVALPGGEASFTGPGPVSLALHGDRLAVAWQGGDRSGAWSSEILLDTLPAPGAAAEQVVLDSETADLRSPAFLSWPSPAGQAVRYGRFDGSSIAPADDAMLRIDSGGGGSRTTLAPHSLRSLTFDGSVAYAMYGQYAGMFPACPAPGCQIVALRAIR